MTPTDELVRQAYHDLRRLARARLGKAPTGHTLQTTALVHEVYLRLVARNGAEWENSGHFFFTAARAMHDVLVEHARSKAAIKRAGGRRRLDLEQLQLAADTPPDEILALSEALSYLERSAPRKHQVVMLRFFAGCSVEEIARAMDLSTKTVERDWRYTRAWLHKKLSNVAD